MKLFGKVIFLEWRKMGGMKQDQGGVTQVLGGNIEVSPEQKIHFQRGLAPNTALDRDITRLGANATPEQIAQAIERLGRPEQKAAFVGGLGEEISRNVNAQNIPKGVKDLIGQLVEKEKTPSGMVGLAKDLGTVGSLADLQNIAKARGVRADLELKIIGDSGTVPTIVGGPENSIFAGNDGIGGRVSFRPFALDAVVDPLVRGAGAAFSMSGPTLGPLQTRVGGAVTGGEVDYRLLLNNTDIGGKESWRMSAGQ
jgi:hypothetical protein